MFPARGLRTLREDIHGPYELWLSANDAYGVFIVVIQMTNSFTIAIDNQQRNINQLFMTMTMSCQKNVIYLLLEILKHFIINILTVNLVENTISVFWKTIIDSTLLVMLTKPNY